MGMRVSNLSSHPCSNLWNIHTDAWTCLSFIGRSSCDGSIIFHAFPTTNTLHPAFALPPRPTNSHLSAPMCTISTILSPLSTYDRGKRTVKAATKNVWRVWRYD
ncbi:hypothetical protein Hypma_004482 [Hypsizygus marmoreus]|uniref:Uncharacterized protein n=1 Tax=Hypsizygus marmoreus TaxID=39966 RepID=A0A369K682_HYPMA|nr:hypothetical protein Hypma_004482 [Hypsizygus marmoreus]